MSNVMELVRLLAGILLLGWALRVGKGLWWTPRKMEKEIRAAGIDGTSYSLRFRDIREMLRLSNQAIANSMPFSHDIASRILPFHSSLHKKYGKIVMSWRGPSCRLCICDPELVREVLQNKSGHVGRPEPKHPGSYIATGLVSLDGDKWFKHRKVVSPAFLADKLKRMQPTFSLCCGELIKRWDDLISPEGSCDVDLWPELQDFTRNIISRAAFGGNSEEGKLIFQLQEEQTDLVARSFIYFEIPCYKFLPTESTRRMKEIDLQMNSLLREIITRREKAVKQSGDGQQYRDLLDLLLHSNQTQGAMSTEDMIEECKLFYFAGQETTSILLTWTMVVLGMHPEWQDRARAEVLQIFGREKPDFERLSKLKIVTMILYEVLRLYPPVVILNRETKAAMKVGEYSLPAGVKLSLPVILIHHDKDYWGEDAAKFNPERFSEGVSKAATNRSPEAVSPFFAFGGGPQICVGQGFAMLEAKMGLASILQRFCFELSPVYAHAPCSVLTLKPQHGAQIILRRV